MKKRNKIVAILLVLVMVTGVFAVAPVSVGAYSAHTQAEALSWVQSQVGNGIGSGECVALITAYYSYLGVSPVNGNGADYTWNDLPAGWQRIQDAQPQPGDILVYTGGYGHVAIYESDYVTYHQNFGGARYVTRVTYKYNGINNPYWGVIRPDFASSSTRGYVMSESEGAGQTIPDGDYWIISKIAKDYFVDIPGNDFNTYNEQNVQTWKWDSGLPPIYDVFHFSYLHNGFYKITQLNTNMAIDVYGGYLECGSNVSMWEYNGTYAQQWSVEKSSNGYKIRSRCNNYYMDIYYGRNENGTNILTWENNNGNNQFFSFIPYVSDEQLVPDGTYIISSTISDTCYLDVAGGYDDFTNLSNVQVWDSPEKFQIEYVGNGYYTISEAQSKLVVEVNDDDTLSYLSSGRNINLFGKNNRKNQFWFIKKNTDDSFCFINKLSGYYLDLERSNTEAGTNVSQCIYNGNPNQKWKLRRVLKDDMVQVDNVKITSNDDIINPEISVIVDNVRLTQDSDYVMTITTDINANKGVVTITGLNDFYGTVVSDFCIRLLGDINLDGKVNIRDVTVLQRHIADVEFLSDGQLTIADANGDGAITIADATHLQQYLAEFDVTLG